MKGRAFQVTMVDWDIEVDECLTCRCIATGVGEAIASPPGHQ